MTALKSQEEALLKLASQLKEAAHSEISTLQATESRLLSVIHNSAQRLRTMQHQHQEQQANLQYVMHNAEKLVQAVLSGGFVMVAGGAAATAAAVYAFSRNGFSMRAGGGGGASGGSGALGGSGGATFGASGAAGRPAAATAAAAATGELYWVGENREEKQKQQTSSRWSSVEVPKERLPLASELPQHMAQMMEKKPAAVGAGSNSSSSIAMQQLQAKAAEAAAAAQSLHSLQQRDADTAVKAAELAASSIEAERRVAEAMRSEALAAQYLLEVERSSKEAAEANVEQLSVEVERLRSQLESQQSSWRHADSDDSSIIRSSNSMGMAVLQKQLSEAHARLTSATQMRSKAEAELREITCALMHEQHQVGDHTQHAARKPASCVGS